jgi:hypothetical protein
MPARWRRLTIAAAVILALALLHGLVLVVCFGIAYDAGWDQLEAGRPLTRPERAAEVAANVLSQPGY